MTHAVGAVEATGCGQHGRTALLLHARHEDWEDAERRSPWNDV